MTQRDQAQTRGDAPPSTTNQADAKSHLIEEANAAYYQTGETILTDVEFDLLAETGLAIPSRNFREKVAHAFPMGSLSKHTEVASLTRFLAKFPGALLVVMPKMDGNATDLSFSDRALCQVATRGDGTTGNNITTNALCAKLLHQLPASFPLDSVNVRAEAIIPQSCAGRFEKNLRNIVAGRLNAKDPQEDVLGLVEFHAFDIVGPTFRTWYEKRAALLDLPQDLRVPFLELTVPKTASECEAMFEQLRAIYTDWKSGNYAIDGVVIWAIPDIDAILPAPSLDPDDKVAVKFGSDTADTEVIDIIWTLGRHDRIVPTLLLAPVELDGSTVQRASASNFSLLKAAGIGIGAKVGVQKAGDIIPFIKHVYEPSMAGVDTLPTCPYCDTQAVLSASGVDALCPSDTCEGKIKVKLQKAFAIFGIEFIADKTIDALVDAGFDSLEKIFALTVNELTRLDGFGKKSANYLVDSLKKITLSEPLVIKLVGLRGIGERKGTMLLDHYGNLDTMLAAVRERGLDDIANFGPKQKEILEKNIDAFEATLTLLRSVGVSIQPYAKAKPAKGGGMMICCTGACPGLTRNQLAEKLAQHGHTMQEDVTGSTQMLLCADPNSGSSKIKKATAKGLPILSYSEFLNTLGP